jgi:hypothetical protein
MSAEVATKKSGSIIPSSWPGAFGLFKNSKEAIRVNVWEIVTIFLALFVINVMLSILVGDYTRHSSGQAFYQILSLLLQAFGEAAFIIAILASVKRRKIDVVETFKQTVPYFLPMLALLIVTNIVLALSFLALIVPFFFVLPRLLLAPYFLVDQNLGPIEALKASWNQSKGHSGKVWGIIGASIVMLLPVLTIIGIPVSIYLLFMYSAAFGILYYHVVKHGPAKA